MKTVIGIDYGTQSARALLLSAEDGRVLASYSSPYPHGILPGDLCSAEDYEDLFYTLLRKVTPEEYRSTVAGICVDATSMTLVPVAADGEILGRKPEFANEPHAQIKLWKCHSAQAQAEEAEALARKMDAAFIRRTGGRISSEWMLPKLLKIRDEAPEIYEKIDLAFDLCEFFTYRLTGEIHRGTGSMGFKANWSPELGFPDRDFMEALRPGFADEYAYKLRGPVNTPGEKVGVLRKELADELGLPDNVAIATGVLDGFTSLVSLGALREGDGAMILGTSSTMTLQFPEYREVPEVCGVAKDGLTKGLYGLDSGQCANGDLLAWFLENGLSGKITDEAKERGMNVHALLCEKIKEPWNCALTVVDWFNGSRNAPSDLSLTGSIHGMTLRTKPEDIYLAMLQGLACGMGENIAVCEASGVPVKRIVATGGITEKNPFMMQQYANLLDRDIAVGNFPEGPALGAGIFAAVAAGIYPDALAGFEAMGVKKFTHYTPDEAHRAEYAAIRQRNRAARVMEVRRQKEK